MKKILLAGTALVGVALMAAPAKAELKLGLGGHFSGYGVYVSEDNDTGFDNFGIRRNTEIHFTGETTLDNGLTVGVHIEQEVENGFGSGNNNESYAYFSGSWGRVNFGNEDGAAYLLQVAAPSADSNVDGLRPTIQGFQSDVVLSYAHADFGNGPSDGTASLGNALALGILPESVDRFTYLTPKFNGFQAGVSYAPRAELASGLLSMPTTLFEDLWEVAARWDGQFEGVGISLGGGYSHADENTGGALDDLKTWNLGVNVAWNQFSLGTAYKKTNNADFAGNNSDTKTWVVGAAWDNGPYHLGASYFHQKYDLPGVDTSKRATFGGGYTFGPGMSFRGAIAFGNTVNLIGAGDADQEFTQVTIGTDIRF